MLLNVTMLIVDNIHLFTDLVHAGASSQTSNPLSNVRHGRDYNIVPGFNQSVK